ncbi:hypothetical protein HPG69_008338 [Diceros bicornis minor]|uniref:Uncharacterized protein n=1 Tax=Diceros bicornis minor TaxID=77932 RepID=A0A7J7EP99_DICBM|nr:hypothetical protein HPG69_008338 [Diceros bicornis minor]
MLTARSMGPPQACPSWVWALVLHLCCRVPHKARRWGRRTQDGQKGRLLPLAPPLTLPQASLQSYGGMPPSPFSRSPKKEAGVEVMLASSASLEGKGQLKFTSGRWSPHHNCTQVATANDTAVRGWDTRSMSQKLKAVDADHKEHLEHISPGPVAVVPLFSLFFKGCEEFQYLKKKLKDWR